MLGLHCLPFVRQQSQLLQLLHLPLQLLAFGVALRRVGLVLGARLRQLLPLPVRPRDLGGERREAGVRVQQHALGIGLEQGLMRMLAMDIDQPLARLAQLAEGRRPAVDESARAPALVDDPPQQHQAGIALEFGRAQPQRELGQRLDVEFGADVRAFAARAHHGGIAALAQGQRQSVDEDGFAGAGLAGKHGEAGLEFEFKRIDDDEIADAERPQHAYSSLRYEGIHPLILP